MEVNAMKPKIDWTQHSLARISLVYQERGGCPEVLPRTDDATLRRFIETLSGNLSADDNYMIGIYNSLGDCKPGTLGHGLYAYYQSTNHTPVAVKGTFPVRYIMIHDAHHVLLGKDTSDLSELQVLAFECGMIERGQSQRSIIPLLSQVRAFPGVPIPEIVPYWELGCNANPGLLETWDLGVAINQPVTLIKAIYLPKCNL